MRFLKVTGISFLICMMLGTLVFLESVSATNLAEPVGWGARSAGMAGANKAVTDDCTALNTNPAAIIQTDGKQLHLGAGVLHPDSTLTNRFASSGTVGHRNWYPLPEIAYVQKIDEKNLWLGIGLFANSGAGLDGFRVGTPFFPNPKEGLSNLGILKFNSAAAFRISSELSLGLALNIYYTSFDLKSPMGPAYIEMNKATGFGYGFTAGLLYQPNRDLSLGVSYSSPSNMQDLKTDDANIETSPYLPPPFSGVSKECKARVIDFQAPQKIIGSLSYKLNDKVALALTGEWVNYSKAFHEITMEIYDAGILNQKTSLPINYRDTFIAACGIAYSTTRNLTFRAGYDYCSDGVPAESVLYLLGANNAQHNFAVGVGYMWDRLSIDLSWVYCLSSKDYTETTKLPGPEYNNSSLEFSVNYFNVSFSWHFD